VRPTNTSGTMVASGRLGVGPRNGERHGGWVVNPEIGEFIEAIQVRVGWKTDLETGGAHSKIEEWPLGV
jgi:hypothetical protein